MPLTRRSWIARLAGAVVSVPATLLAVLFAVSNRDPVTVRLWPLPEALETPLYMLGLLALLAGFLLGGAVVWIGAGRDRRRARRAERRAAELARQLRAESRSMAAGGAEGAAAGQPLARLTG